MNVLGHTWYGPALLMLIPASLCWVGFGAETPRAARFFIAASLTLAVICLLIIRGASRAGIFT
jgi:cytochrome b